MIPLHPFHISNVGQQTFLGLWHHQPRNGQASVKRSSLWKPVTLRLPLLMSMIILTLSFIAILEYLSRKSQIDGGVVLAREGFSSATAFLYLNLPTIIAIFYSLLWSWIDLDTKRLEPWFQLSKPGGANEGDSLSLHYPFDFVAVAPLSALRKKHWAVVFAGTATTLIFWGVTPLAGSIFSKSLIEVRKEALATTSASLMPLQEQSASLNTNFMMTAYGVVWLGQALPGFVTTQGSLEPFELHGGHAGALMNTTWTARTKLFGTSLSCQAAEVRNHSSGYVYSNNKGCTTFPAAITLVPESQFGGRYIGYHTDQHSDYSLPGCGCRSDVNAHLFLALWGQSWTKHPEVPPTAVFCEPNYWTQDVNATVLVPTMVVMNILPLGPQHPLTDSQFNRTALEYNIGTGSQPISQRADISETTSLINQRAKLAEVGFNDTMTNMIGFALGLGRHSPAEYANAQKLASSFEKAHKLVHALAINDLMTRSLSSNDSKPAIISGRSNAIVVVRPLSAAVESLLGIVITLITGLILQSRRRRSQLQRDPASLTDMIRMMPKDSVYNTLADCQKPGAPRCTTSLIEGRICVSKTEAVNAHRSTAVLGKGSVKAPQDGADRVYPFETTLRVGIAFITLLGISIAVTVALKVVMDKNHGLPLPSRNTTVNQLILNYVPIVFATFLEPFWLLLNRVLCVLKPLQALSKADATSSRSLDLKYTSLPPQLTFVRALRARHYMLVAVCAIGLSANLLAVSLNGLMESSVHEIELAETFSPQFSPIFQRNDHSIQSSDYQYIAKTNFSDGLSLPPWTASDRFFVPFVLKAESGLGEVRSNRATTQGFGIQANCQQSTFNDTAFITGENNFFYTRERTPAGRLVSCGGFSQPFGGQNRSSAALEVFLQLRPVSIDEPKNGFNLFPQSSFLINATQDELLTCNSILVAGFLRGNLTVSFNNTKTQNSDISQTPDILGINSLSSLWMTCRPRLVTAPYDVTVDLSGRVETYEAAGPDEVDLQPFFADGVTPASLVGAVTTILSYGQDTQPYWHNDTLVDTWFAYFVKHRSNNSTIFIDPAAAVPQFESVAPHVEDVYARLSAIVLSRNQPWLAPADEKLAVSGFLVVSCQRVLMSQVMFVITVVLLALNMIVAVAYWTGRPSRILPRMPYTIASIMDMLQGSGLVSDVENVERWKTEWKFGYGRYVDTGGKPRLGIERRPFIIPLAS